MATTEHQLHEQHRAMVQDLGARHAHLKQLDPGDAAFDEQYEDLVARAEQLLEFERLLPGRLAEPQRQRSEQIVRWSWRAQTVVAVALIAAVFALGHTAWWLVLLIPHLLATLPGWSVKVTAARHKLQRRVAIGLHALCLLVALVGLEMLSAWWITAVVIGWVIVGVASESDTQQGAK